MGPTVSLLIFIFYLPNFDIYAKLADGISETHSGPSWTFGASIRIYVVAGTTQSMAGLIIRRTV